MHFSFKSSEFLTFTDPINKKKYQMKLMEIQYPKEILFEIFYSFLFLSINHKQYFQMKCCFYPSNLKLILQMIFVNPCLKLTLCHPFLIKY